jgi:hypothetical protein
LNIIKKRKPTKRIKKELALWETELSKLSMSSTDMKKVREKIWSIREDFEEELRAEEKGWKIERRTMYETYKNREKLFKK